MSAQLHVSSSSFAANLLGYQLIIISKKGLEKWANEHNIPQPQLNVLQKELKSIISALNR
jgi:hypothetical protein